jgi:hypothetical protein
MRYKVDVLCKDKDCSFSLNLRKRVSMYAAKVSPAKKQGMFEVSGAFSVSIPALPRPTLAEIQRRFCWIQEILVDVSPTSEVSFGLARPLYSGEAFLRRESYEERLGFLPAGTALGFQHACWLVEYQDDHLWFRNFPDRVLVDFPGFTAGHTNNGCVSPFLSRAGECWTMGFRWTGADLNQRWRTALVRP